MQSTCDDPATDVVNRVGSALSATYDVTTANDVAGTTYWIVLSEIDPGMQPKMAFLP